tara:strand:- start:13295 stop:13834 length:540 start_codon:yes stop_codon:yes gene_type:complete
MNLSLYKPNSKNTGCAFNFSIGQGSKNLPALYVSAIQQYNWDDKTKKGSFSENKDDPNKNINVKFNEWEVGSMISAFNNRHEYSAYHTFDENSTTIKLTPWDKSVKSGDKTIIMPAFGIVFTRNGNQQFRLPLEAGEVEALKIFLKKYLDEYITSTKLNYKNQSTPKQKSITQEDEAPF